MKKTDKTNSLQVKKITLVDAVIDQMIKAIKNGRFIPGEKIPSEKILTQEFGVSRTTLREAFKKLEMLGGLSIKQGNGTYILESSVDIQTNKEDEHENSADVAQSEDLTEKIRNLFSIEGSQLSHYLEAREAIELYALELGVLRADDSDLANISNILAQQKSALESAEKFCKLDFEFHRLLVSTSKNSFLYNFWISMSPIINQQITRACDIPGMTNNAYSTHIKIEQAFRNGDIKRLQSLAVDHLRIVPGRMLSNITNETK